MKFTFAICLIGILCFTFSCKKNPDPTLQEQLDSGTSMSDLLETYPVDSFYGKEYLNGYIFSLKSTGSGMVVGKTDISTNAWWGCSGNNLNGCEGTLFGTGKQNTEDFIQNCSDFNAAGNLCYYWNEGGYTNWFLPSEDELELVYQNVHTKGIGGFANNFYWSSTEVPTLNAAQHVLFDDGSVSFSTKTNAHYVRAVREF